MTRKLLFIVNVDWFFISHRLPIARAALSDGFEVHVATVITDEKNKLESMGFVVHPINLIRGKSNPLQFCWNFLEIFRLLHREKPDVLHLVTIKPIIFGGIASRLLRLKRVIISISGLGFIFVSKGKIANVRRTLVKLAFKASLSYKGAHIIFQNSDDRDFISNLVGLRPFAWTMIRGSGVDLEIWKPNYTRRNNLLIILPARMLRDKGVFEFVDAARVIFEEGLADLTKSRFVLLGGIDLDNPACISQDEIKTWVQNGHVEYWGWRSDVKDIISKSSIVVLPSYREGFPKALIEAAACGVPVITTDVPGCREAIIPNKTGLLVSPQSTKELVLALKVLIKSPKKRQEMGRKAREFAEASFSIEKVIKIHLKLYNDSF